MTLTEFRNLVKESENPKWFNSVETQVNFPKVDVSVTFKGLPALYKYVLNQLKAWSKYNEEYPSELSSSETFFINFERTVADFINSHKGEANETRLNSFHNSSIKSVLNRQGPSIFTADSSKSKFLVELHMKNPNYSSPAYNFLVGNNLSFNSRDNVIGYLLAYEFLVSDDSTLISRKELESKSLQELKDNFKEATGKVEQDLNAHLADSEVAYKAYLEKLDDYLEEKKEQYENWSKSLGELYEGAMEEISTLESTYKEKLKLAEPANYWEERGKKLRKQGRWAMFILIVLVGVVVWSLGELLWKVPEQIYSSFFEGDKSVAIRWSVIYITFISFMAFAVRAITKVMFSSFHLARDSEERYTLTYFYLSLLKDSSVDKEDRQLIMQSLFSRAETGLLKDDSTPAMPNDVVGKFFSGKG